MESENYTLAKKDSFQRPLTLSRMPTRGVDKCIIVVYTTLYPENNGGTKKNPSFLQLIPLRVLIALSLLINVIIKPFSRPPDPNVEQESKLFLSRSTFLR